jgi:hypothetical protein
MVVRVTIVGACTIEVGDEAVTASSPHLFALLLILATNGERRITRAALHALLVEDLGKGSSAAHRVRQLLYRARSYGLRLDETQQGMRVSGVDIRGPLHSLQSLNAEARAALRTEDLQILPGYAPPPLPALAHWLEDLRDRISHALTRLLAADVTLLRASHSWEALSRTCSHIRDIDPLNDDVTLANAEALANLGRREDALDVIDSFFHTSGTINAAPEALRRLRTRLSKPAQNVRKSTFRGRGACLSHLSAQWIAASTGGARIVTLLGAPGIGKTRVLRDFSSSLSVAGAKVIHCNGDASSRQFPLAPFAEMLPELFAMRGSLGISPHHRTLLSRLEPSTARGHVIAAGAALELLRAELVLAILDLLEAVSAERPLIITVDDAHLVDDATLMLLRHLAASSNSAALLVVACCRPRDRALSLISSHSRSTSFTLMPLSDGDSKAVLLELAPHLSLAEERLEWCVRQAGGNPFYLHSLSRVSSDSAPLPFDIASLASTSYHRLTSPARLVLESCLHLSALATTARLLAVTGLDDISLLEALRELEELDLVSLQGTTVRGPHSLLEDALRGLIPTTVSALVHRRVAMTLASECSTDKYVLPVALACARSWMACGDFEAAETLLQRCAADIARSGDPATAADLLSQIAFDSVRPDSKRLLLDDLILYADAGGARGLALQAISDRLHLATSLNESQAIVDRLTFRLLEADLFTETRAAEAAARLSAMLATDTIEDSLRMQCIATLLIAADAEYDSALAAKLAATLASLSARPSSLPLHELRALLIYHTTFGDKQLAFELTEDLTQRFPEPAIDEPCRMARRFTSYSLYRMMRHGDAKRILEDDYDFMSSRGVRSEAVYAASLLAEIEISAGNFAAARAWFSKLELQLKGASAHRLSPNSGYYSSAALFAMMDGRHDDAAQLLAIPLAEDARMRTARYEAILTALQLRLSLSKGALSTDNLLLARLKDLYERGRARGGQDTVVEIIWSAEVLAGRTAEASQLLLNYLTKYRREGYPVEWSLRSTTAADEAWSALPPEALCELRRDLWTAS